MIYPEVNLQVWLERWGLEIESWTCDICGKEFETTVPILAKDSAGLVTPEHGCNPYHCHAIFTPRTAESIAFWNTIV